MSRRATKTRTTIPRQRELQFPRQHGGRRDRAGRPPNGEKAGVPHGVRAAHAARFPVHVTVKLKAGLPRLRRRAEHAALRGVFAAASSRGARSASFRLCHYAVLNDHLHLIVEADDRSSLSRGMQGLLVRVARALNRLWQRKGTVFADRYHDEVLKSPAQVRNAVRYVLANGMRHGCVAAGQVIDVFSSAAWFDGFLESVTVRGIEGMPRPVGHARTWLLRMGWRVHGLISVHERPRAG